MVASGADLVLVCLYDISNRRRNLFSIASATVSARRESRWLDRRSHPSASIPSPMRLRVPKDRGRTQRNSRELDDAHRFLARLELIEVERAVWALLASALLSNSAIPILSRSRLREPFRPESKRWNDI